MIAPRRGSRVVGYIAIMLIAAAIGLYLFASRPWLLDRYDAFRRSSDQVREITTAPGLPMGTRIWVPLSSNPTGIHRRPVVIFVHGGSWKDGRAGEYGFVGRTLAERGFVTVLVDYRKAPQARFPVFVDDTAQVVAWAHSHIATLGGDPDRLALMGHSAGAHIAALVALDPHYLAKAGAPANCVRAFVGLAGPYDFLPFTSDAAKDALGHWPRVDETQPIHYARGDAPPMLLLTGDADTTVKPRNSDALAQAIQQRGGQASVKRYAGVDHVGIVMALSLPFRDKASVLDDSAAFLMKIMPDNGQ